MSNTLHNFALVRFSKKTGKIDTTMTAIGKGLLQLWALQNTTKTKVSLIIDLDEERTVSEYHGTSTGLPDIFKEEKDFCFDLPGELVITLKEEVATR